MNGFEIIFMTFFLIADSVCSNNSISAINDGSPFFACPLADNADNETRCCGQPGEQVCCADPSVDPPFLSEIGGKCFKNYLLLKSHMLSLTG